MKNSPVPRLKFDTAIAVELYAKHGSLEKVGLELGVTGTAIANRLKKAGIAIKPVGRPVGNDTLPGCVRTLYWRRKQKEASV